jgi:ribonuclease HI
MAAILWFDGARYFDHSKYAFILKIDDKKIEEVGRTTGTNVDAEYNAVIYGIQKAIDMGVQELAIIGDSRTVLHQITGQMKARKTKDKLQEAMSLLELIPKYSIEWIPSIENPAHKLF